MRYKGLSESEAESSAEKVAESIQKLTEYSGFEFDYQQTVDQVVGSVDQLLEAIEKSNETEEKGDVE